MIVSPRAVTGVCSQRITGDTWWSSRTAALWRRGRVRKRGVGTGARSWRRTSGTTCDLKEWRGAFLGLPSGKSPSQLPGRSHHACERVTRPVRWHFWLLSACGVGAAGSPSRLPLGASIFASVTSDLPADSLGFRRRAGNRNGESPVSFFQGRFVGVGRRVELSDQGLWDLDPRAQGADPASACPHRVRAVARQNPSSNSSTHNSPLRSPTARFEHAKGD